VTTLAEREAAFRATLDPQMSIAETEANVVDWLRHQPEARQENLAILRGQITAAQDALWKAAEMAAFLGWPTMVDDMGEMRMTLGSMRKVVAG